MSPSTVFVITTIAGTGASSYSGDNGAATAAAMYYPFGFALDTSGTKPHPKIVNKEIFSLTHLGNMYIADYYNFRIRKVTVSTGIITTIAGTGTSSYSGDNGPATSAALNYPSGVALDPSGLF